MCSPCGPMVCYKYEDCGPAKGKPSDGANRVEEGGAEHNKEKENQLRRTKSRELRGGIMYYSCHCIKRNGLQHDCRRTGCGGEPACLALPDPLCAPSQLARARGLADPAVLAPHLAAQNGGPAVVGASSSGGGTGKRFIVCELKSIMPAADTTAGRQGTAGNNCCKCTQPTLPTTVQNTCGPSTSHKMTPTGFACVFAPGAGESKPQGTHGESHCCSNKSGQPNKNPVFVLDEKMLQNIMDRFDSKPLAEEDNEMVVGPGGLKRPKKKIEKKEEPCTRPGCLHWKPPPPCVWDLPCKADCFEAHPGIQPGRNPLSKPGADFLMGCNQYLGPGVKSRVGTPNIEEVTIANTIRQKPNEKMKLLTPDCCAGCCGAADGAAATGGPTSGLPMLVMKLC